MISAVALCTTRPAEAFGTLAFALARDPELAQHSLTRYNAAQLSRDLCDLVADALIGTAQQVAKNSREANRPHSRVVWALNKAAGGGAFDPFWAYTAPHDEFGNMQPSLGVPMFLRSAEPQGFSIQLPPGMDEIAGMTLLATSAVTAQLSRVAVGSRTRGDEALDRLEWLRGDRSPIELRLDLDQVQQHDTATILSLVDPDRHTAHTGRELAQLWGRAFLLAPRELDPHGDAVLASLASVQDYLKAVNREFPAFAAILSWPFGYVDWFSAIAPEALCGTDLNILHPSVSTAVDGAARAIYALGERSGQNPTLLVELMRMRLSGPTTA
jgi:hypothetical protein